MKRIILLTVLMISFVFSIQTAFASEYVLKEVLKKEFKQEFNIEYSSKTIEKSLQSYNYLISWNSFITHTENRELVIEGTTRTFSIVDTISTRIYLQKYDPNIKAWRNLDNILNTENNANYSYSGGVYTVSPGEYRVFTTHSIKKGAFQESTTSVTNSIVIR